MANKPISEDRRNEMLETCFNCYCEYGLKGTGIKKLAEACDMSTTNLFFHFGTIDNIIIESTAYCMAKVEDEFMAKAPKNFADLPRFLHEVPEWTAKEHGKKYRFMYQVYSSPQYIEYGKEFFKGVTMRYTEYAKQLEAKLGISWQKMLPLIFIFVRASVHYAMFGDENYLKPQIDILEETVKIMAEKYSILLKGETK